MTQFNQGVNRENCVICNKTLSGTKKTTTKPRKKSTAPRRFALQIGKNICLALMAKKYDFDLRIDSDGGAK